MYKIGKVRELLDARGIKVKDLGAYLGRSGNSFMRNLDQNIKVATLEKLADFFQVPTDTFFERDYVPQEEKELERLRELLAEKDGRIAALEQANRLLNEKVARLEKPEGAE